jgi:hypothetical protein
MANPESKSKAHSTQLRGKLYHINFFFFSADSQFKKGDCKESKQSQKLYFLYKMLWKKICFSKNKKLQQRAIQTKFLLKIFINATIGTTNTTK